MNDSNTEQHKDKRKEKVWNISPENLEELKISSNRYNVFQNEYSTEFPTLISPQKKKVVDQFLINKVHPTKEVMLQWSDEMKSYFQENWKESSTEVDVGTSENRKQFVEEVLDDYSEISNMLTKNDIVNGNKNVLFEEGSESLFNV